jgi:hypothetical protein
MMFAGSIRATTGSPTDNPKIIGLTPRGGGDQGLAGR